MKARALVVGSWGEVERVAERLYRNGKLGLPDRRVTHGPV